MGGTIGEQTRCEGEKGEGVTKTGRPRTSGNEAGMLHVWRIVQEEMHRQNNFNVCRACQRVMKRRGGLLRFYDRSKKEHEQLVAVIKSWKALKTRYYEAEKARHDAERFPILHARTAHLEQSLPQDAASHLALQVKYKQMEKEGYARDGSTLPAEKRNELAGLYLSYRHELTGVQLSYLPPR